MSTKTVKVCLDAGHYGAKYNQSTEVPAYYESEMAWKLHLYLKEEMEAYGFEVITTRQNQADDLELYTRGATSKGCDLFISLHSNACGTESVDYPVVFRAYDNWNSAEAVALPLSLAIGKLMGTNQDGKTGTREGTSGTEYYGVMRGARAVGCPLYLLIEHSFHTNKAASLWLLEDANLRALAKLEADYFANYYGMTKEDEGGDEPVVDVIPEWMEESVNWMVENGLMAGDGDGNYRVNEAVTRGEFSVMLHQYHKTFHMN